MFENFIIFMFRAVVTLGFIIFMIRAVQHMIFLFSGLLKNLMFGAVQTFDYIDVCLGLFKYLIIFVFAGQTSDYINT